ncbi:hypothetical protein OEIGOIKO_07238 [Streptomyces chrestomyceticus JCM 4735]|uniref:Uncharacterized protein n=1 Tax=Streptomyces chrestomyceticus JCM 4735 TaxID=1306181 RepID=A0A7U9L377_9ACTN|nr:hypothetical protein [Streptomyces chrestomyceticus]GCD39408.1 hypothetical protein OEIGOIKO_07238 [Streptomyces chrestomyceticus JCM 4735]
MTTPSRRTARTAPTASSGPAARRMLRREIPSTAAVLADAQDFAAMRRYRTFPFDDHTAYLQQMEALLRSLTAQGIHTTVALFDPVAYETYCTDTDLDPDRPDSRSRYTAEVACTGATLPYTGESLSRLLPVLIDEAERQAMWDRATALLARTGACADCGEDLARAAFARASRAVTGLLDALGDGTHHLVCSVPASGTPLLAVLHADSRDDGRLELSEAATLVFCTVLAAGVALRSPGGIVSRTAETAGRDTVRGWVLRDAWLHPLSAAEVFTAYCTDADTGEPVPPEPGVDYHAGLALPDPPPTDGHDHSHH